jgi:hypothetical protein
MTIPVNKVHYLRLIPWIIVVSTVTANIVSDFHPKFLLQWICLAEYFLFSMVKKLVENVISSLPMLIRRTKHNLTIKLHTQVDWKSQDESILTT